MDGSGSSESKAVFKFLQGNVNGALRGVGFNCYIYLVILSSSLIDLYNQGAKLSVNVQMRY